MVDVKRLDVVGNTLRMSPRHEGTVCTALLVNDNLASHFWLNLLAMVCVDARLRHYITEQDYASVSDHVHVQPRVAPAFLVFSHGYIVDWFPAPLPPPNRAVAW